MSYFQDQLLIFMEYCDEGTLETIIKEGLDILFVRQYTNKLLLGVDYLHEKRIVHRDIKREHSLLKIPTSKACRNLFIVCVICKNYKQR